MNDITKKFGKAVCVALYAHGAYNAAKKRPMPLLILIASHLCEYFIVARKLGEEKSISPVETFVNCLAFGFTWWLPIKKAE